MRRGITYCEPCGMQVPYFLKERNVVKHSPAADKSYSIQVLQPRCKRCGSAIYVGRYEDINTRRYWDAVMDDMSRPTQWFYWHYLRKHGSMIPKKGTFRYWLYRRADRKRMRLAGKAAGLR